MKWNTKARVIFRKEKARSSILQGYACLVMHTLCHLSWTLPVRSMSHHQQCTEAQQYKMDSSHGSIANLWKQHQHTMQSKWCYWKQNLAVWKPPLAPVPSHYYPVLPHPLFQFCSHTYNIAGPQLSHLFPPSGSFFSCFILLTSNHLKPSQAGPFQTPSTCPSTAFTTENSFKSQWNIM